LKEHRVLVITNDTVLGYAMTNLFSDSHDGIRVTISQAQTLEDLVKEIQDYQASILLFEKSHPHGGEKELTKIQKLHPNLKIIIVTEESNWMQIIGVKDILMSSSQDLINLIRSI
jgi:DNA-binding NarL/FixJ family response regulator